MYGPILRGTASGREVKLRPPRLEEAARMIDWMADPEVTATLSRRFVPSLGQEEELLKRWAEDREQVVWAIDYDGQLVGMTGIHQIDPINRRATTGILIGEKRVWRKGIASEVMRLRTAYAFNELGLHKLKSGYLEGNEGSRRAQEKAGYRTCGVDRREHWRGGRWHDVIRTELLYEDWLKLQSDAREREETTR